MIIKELAVGPIQANCYIVGCEETNKAAVIDPGDDADRILMTMAESKLTADCIINTHGHFDHVGANKRLKEVTNADLMIHELDAPMLSQLAASAGSMGLQADDSPAADRILADGDTITFGNITMTVLHTPGHTLGGISLYTEGHVFVGDTLFAGSVGRTDFPGGDFATLKASVKSKLYVLDDDTIVYPGTWEEPPSAGKNRAIPLYGLELV